MGDGLARTRNSRINRQAEARRRQEHHAAQLLRDGGWDIPEPPATVTVVVDGITYERNRADLQQRAAERAGIA